MAKGKRSAFRRNSKGKSEQAGRIGLGDFYHILIDDRAVSRDGVGWPRCVLRHAPKRSGQAPGSQGGGGDHGYHRRDVMLEHVRSGLLSSIARGTHGIFDLDLVDHDEIASFERARVS